MNRTLKCIRFEFGHLCKEAGIFTAIFFAAYLAIILLVYCTLSATGTSTTNMNFSFAAVIFSFVLMASSYKGHYNNLMMFGNTRSNILFSFFLKNLILSAFFGVISILSDYFNLLCSQIFHFQTFAFLKMIYENKPGSALQLVWFFTLFTLIGSVGLLYGALAYKFGRQFKRWFWIGFGLFWVLTPLFTFAGFRSTVYHFFLFFFGLRQGAGILHATLHF
ncbi:MAG TPA: hypothetical protein VHR42_09725, partial [Clostridia bacterium]|nr:hypothetical protein [Clostridia bacterium]